MKRISPKSAYFLAVIAIFAVLTGACAGSARYSIRVMNGTSDTICELRTRGAHSYSRLSRNYLGKNQRLQPGEEFVISGLKEGWYDIEAEICNSTEPGYIRLSVEVGPNLHPTWIIGQ